MSQIFDIYLSGQKINNYISEIGGFTYEKGDYGQATINPISQISGINGDGFWDSKNPRSPVYNSDITQIDLKIYDSGNSKEIFNGYLSNIHISGRNATVYLKSNLSKALEKKLIYVSSAISSPALAAYEICKYYKIEMDESSFLAAADFYLNRGAYISVSFIRPETSVLDALNELCNIGCAAIYSFKNKLYFSYYGDTYSDSERKVLKDTKLIFNYNNLKYWPKTYLFNEIEHSMLSIPDISMEETEKALGYSVEWAGTPTAFYGEEKDRSISINAGADNPIKITTLNGAIFFAEQWLKYTNTKKTRISFRIPTNYAKEMELGQIIGANWNDIDYGRFEIYKISIEDKLTSTIEGLILATDI